MWNIFEDWFQRDKFSSGAHLFLVEFAEVHQLLLFLKPHSEFDEKKNTHCKSQMFFRSRGR